MASTHAGDRPYPWVAVISMVTVMVFGIVFLGYSSCSQQSEIRGAGHAFLEALREDRIDEAYAMMVRDVRRNVDGAVTAYPPTAQGQRGTFAIVFQGEVQHGLWQP